MTKTITSPDTTIKAVTPEMVKALRLPLPKEAVSPHPSKPYLSTIKAIYVTERLSDVFGTGSWQLHVEHITSVPKGNRMMVVVKTTLSIPEYGIYIEQFGGNDNDDLGDAYKGAVTDAITKIGSYLGIAIDVFKGLSDTPKVDAYAKPGKNYWGKQSDNTSDLPF